MQLSVTKSGASNANPSEQIHAHGGVKQRWGPFSQEIVKFLVKEKSAPPHRQVVQSLQKGIVQAHHPSLASDFAAAFEQL